MYTRLAVSVAIFAVLVSVHPLAATQDLCDKTFTVSEVSLTTNHLSQREQGALRGLLIGRCFDDQKLGELAGQVRAALQDWGYLRATVSEPSMTITDNTRLPQLTSLHVEVEEGPRFKVREIDVLGSKVLTFDQIRSVFQIQLDDFLDMSEARSTAEAIRRLYAANGYLETSVVPQVRFLSGVEVCVAFKVEEGPRSR